MAVGDIAVYATAEDRVLVGVGVDGVVVGAVGPRPFGKVRENIIDICHRNSINDNTLPCGEAWKGRGS